MIGFLNQDATKTNAVSSAAEQLTSLSLAQPKPTPAPAPAPAKPKKLSIPGENTQIHVS